MSTPSALSRELLAALGEKKVRFVHWKSNIHLAEALAGETDLDLLVHPDDADGFRLAVSRIGFLVVKTQPWASYPEVEDWLGMDEGTGSLLHLHVHFQLVTGIRRVKHLYLPWTEHVLKTAAMHESGWPVPSPEMELLIFQIRIWAKTPPLQRIKSSPVMPRSIYEELAWLLNAADPKKFIDLANSLGVEIDEELIAALKGSGKQDALVVASIAKALYRQVRGHYRVRWFVAIIKSTFFYAQKALMSAFSKYVSPCAVRKTFRTGVAIALIGSDGAGKSSLSRDLILWLRYKMDSHPVYLGSGNGRTGVVNAVRKFLAGVKSGGGRKAREGSRPKLEVSLPRKLYRLFDLSLMRRKLRLIRKAKKLADNGSVIIYDRYPQKWIYGISDGPKLQHGESFDWAAKSELELYEAAERLAPDCVIKLLVTPSSAHARKPDHDIEAIMRKCEIIRALDFPGSSVCLLDADRPYDEVLLEAKRVVWKELQRANGH